MNTYIVFCHIDCDMKTEAALFYTLFKEQKYLSKSFHNYIHVSRSYTTTRDGYTFPYDSTEVLNYAKAWISHIFAKEADLI